MKGDPNGKGPLRFPLTKRFVNLEGTRIDLAFHAALAEFDTCDRSGLVALEQPLDLEKHADVHVIRDWLKRKNADSGAPELAVVAWLATGARHEWDVLPLRTAAEHRKLFNRIAHLCRDLRDRLTETGATYQPGGKNGLAGATIDQLLTDTELDSLLRWIRTEPIPIEFEDDRALLERSFGKAKLRVLPTVEDILDRVATIASELETVGPTHAQPKKRGALRGYFVRRIGKLFQQRYDEQPHEVIAAVATIALGEATDRELVSKLLANGTL